MNSTTVLTMPLTAIPAKVAMSSPCTSLQYPRLFSRPPRVNNGGSASLASASFFRVVPPSRAVGRSRWIDVSGGDGSAGARRARSVVRCALANPPESAFSESELPTPTGDEASGAALGAESSLASSDAAKSRWNSEFVWEKNWYPVSLIEDLDPSRPTSFQLLGRDLVIWRDAQGIWRAHADRCPHRLAPLSEGRIDENGLLQCPYHGWSFRGDGTCAVIPQASDTGPESRACASSRACMVAYPALVSQGLLFVWPEEGRWDEALAVEPPRLPDAFEDERFSTVTIQRDLYYGFDTLMENVSDPSHIEFAHHSVTGRRDRAKPLPFTITSSGPFGFEATTGTSTPTTVTPAKNTNHTTASGVNTTANKAALQDDSLQADSGPVISSWFIAPCTFFSRIDLSPTIPVIGRQQWELWICSFNVPMGPGKTRSIVCSARNFARLTVPGAKWWQLYPRWLEHLESNKIYDGDMIVLQGQEKLLRRGGAAAAEGTGTKTGERGGGAKGGGGGAVPYNKLTYTPAAADRMVLTFRNWLRRYGGGDPAWDPSLAAGSGADAAPLPSTVLTRAEMLDRLGQHTEKCSSCRAALRNVRRLSAVLAGAAAVLLAAAVVAPEGAAGGAGAAAAAGAVAAGGAGGAGTAGAAAVYGLLKAVLTLKAGLAMGALASLAAAAWLKYELEPQFVHKDYVHADVE